ncbi:hypothetical protein [Leptospira sp. GIMC2001]|uniref:hypothetical protein n=1 Tax=Leptospira sp. GIMC2001 TaxID=1513297 RepID=UPI00234A4126|nr:hypothetical protein [Leptospira sp. GIMC2001]WCL51489.1 hypothetical protein O4O04_19940 [Leptospira sp. GIMC2001]
MNGVELIETNDGTWYWRMDYRHSDNKGGIYLESPSYKTEQDAIYKMTHQAIEWEVGMTHDLSNPNIQKSIQELAQEKFRKVLEQREEILTAFIAKYGCQPEELEQVVIGSVGFGEECFSVRKKEWRE